jgi:hypothetical protein
MTKPAHHPPPLAIPQFRARQLCQSRNSGTGSNFAAFAKFAACTPITVPALIPPKKLADGKTSASIKL